jgi:hypothetical protein
MGSRRTIITLSEEEKRWLEGYSQAHRVSLAEAVRQAVCMLRKSSTKESYLKLVDGTRGVWKGEDGLKYQTRIRSEWGE